MLDRTHRKPRQPSAIVETLETRALLTNIAGIVVPTGFTAGSQSTSGYDSSISKATLTDGSSNHLTAWYTNGGTGIYCITQYQSGFTPDDPEPLPPDEPGTPPPPPLPPAPGPILPGVAVPTASSDTNGSVVTVTSGDDTYYYRDSTTANGTVVREWLSAASSGYVYLELAIAAPSSGGSGGD